MSQPVILSLPDWVEQGISTLYKAQSADEFSEAFDAFLSARAQIKVNGKPLAREQYKRLLLGEITDSDVPADVAFNGVVAVPDAAKGTRPAVVTGTVGAFFKATMYGRTMVFAQRTSNTITSSLNVAVYHDPDIHVGPPEGPDNRRVMILDEVLTDVHNPEKPPTAA